MLSFYDRPTRLCDGLTRREWLRLGTLGLAGAGLSASRPVAASASSAGAEKFGKARSCIVLFLLGGPPQHETWDPKPDAPPEVRGEFGVIPTKTSGLFVGELMPRTAALTNHIAVLRALATDDNAHSSSGYWMLTGQPHTPKNSENGTPGFPNDWPSTAGVVQHLRGRKTDTLPTSIRLPEEIWNTGRIVWPGQDAGFLGRASDPWLLTCQPQQDGFEVPGLSVPAGLTSDRADGRKALFEQVNRRLDDIARSGAVETWTGTRQQAFELIGGGRARAAFDLRREPEALRDRYGRNRFGQSVLLARRLVEAGVSFVQVNWQRWDYDTAENPAWDTHTKNAARCKNDLMPPMDLAYSALLEDLADRGRLDETLVVWMGEFGRSPKINGAGGRDHWGHVYSAALAGGGVRGGVVYGASDKLGGYPVEGRVEPQDLTATLFHLLGHPPETEIHDRLGRPLPISRGKVLTPVL